MCKVLNDAQIIELPWHDSDISNLTITWSKDGFAIANMVIEINSEESFQPLIDIGIDSDTVEIKFSRIWRFVSNIHGDVYPKELLLDWDVVKSSTLIEEILKKIGAQKTELRHHKLLFSGGSTLDIVFEEICIEEFHLSQLSTKPS